MKWVLLLLALAFATQLWLCFRVARTSVPLAILTFFLGGVGALYTVFKHRGDEETSVTVPFLANLVFSVLFLVAAWYVVVPMIEEAEAREFGLPTAETRSPARDSAAVQAPALVASEPSAAASAAVVASTPVAVVDPFDAFSQALKSAGLNHAVTRLPDATKLPAGVTDAALYSVATAPAAGAASAPDYAATLFKCESANACRNLAGAQMQQNGRRVLQNGLLLLATPPVVPNDVDITPAALASTFRKFQP